MKDAIIEAVIIGFAVWLGFCEVAEALRNVQVDMKPITLRIASEADDGAR